jgi:PelA/Pel-15E family pectate lyase
VAAVEGAVDWLRSAAIQDIRVEAVTIDGQSDRVVVNAPGAEPVWARFYALDADAPIFMGRDSIARATLAEIERERRAGYAYYGTWPQALLSVEYPAWRARLASAAP